MLAGLGFLRSAVQSKDERPACDSSVTPATRGQTALRDADRSPRVEIPLPGGDRLLSSPALTCSATMLTLRFLAIRESR